MESKSLQLNLRLAKQKVKKKLGHEKFFSKGADLNIRVLDFWKWSGSNLLSIQHAVFLQNSLLHHRWAWLVSQGLFGAIMISLRNPKLRLRSSQRQYIKHGNKGSHLRLNLQSLKNTNGTKKRESTQMNLFDQRKFTCFAYLGELNP